MANIETFNHYVEQLNQWKQAVPIDDMLRLYAYYKLGTQKQTQFFDHQIDIIRSFKYNAIQQVSHFTEEEAREAYIQLAKKILGEI